MVMAIKSGMLFILICVAFVQVQGAKILMFPLMAKSHTLDQACLAEELVSRGNEVYFIVHEDQQFPALLDKLQGAHILAFPREAFGPGSNVDEFMDTATLRAIEGKGDIAEFSKWIAKLFGDMCGHCSWKTKRLCRK